MIAPTTKADAINEAVTKKGTPAEEAGVRRDVLPGLDLPDLSGVIPVAWFLDDEHLAVANKK